MGISGFEDITIPWKELEMSEVQVLMTGLVLGESPRWHKERLWLSDWGAQEVIAVDLLGNSEVEVRVPPIMPFSIDWLPEPDGRLLILSGKEGLLLREEPDGSLVTHADLRGVSTHPWNEIIVDGRGNIYTNSSGFDFPGGEFAPGIIALITPQGTVRQVADGLAFPNGMAVTPDNATLIVAESYASKLTAFDIVEDGSLSNRRVWAGLPGGAAPDGICLDAEGAIWYADVPNRCCVRVREGGEVLQRVEIDRGCFAGMLGGEEKPVLFMIAAEWVGLTGVADEGHEVLEGHEPHGTHGAQRGPTGQVLTVEAPAPHAGWP
jgi:sugar lactone lactonase YvrE